MGTMGDALCQNSQSSEIKRQFWNNKTSPTAIPGIGIQLFITDENIKEFSTKREGAKRSVAILTISRRSGEGDDRERDSSTTGTLLSQRELDTFDSIKKYFDKIVIVLN